MVIHIQASHHFAALEAERHYEISKKKKKTVRFYASTAGGQNDTNKLPEREPVPSSPAADNEASLGHGLCEIMG